MQYLPGKPLTPDQLIMLEHDNVVAPGALGFADLGIAPTPVESVVPSYLGRFKPGEDAVRSWLRCRDIGYRLP